MPGPGAYNIAQPIHDYRGIYKNMGKKKDKKSKNKDNAEGEESEEESEPEPSEKSVNSENEGDKDAKLAQPDEEGAMLEEDMKP